MNLASTLTADSAHKQLQSCYFAATEKPVYKGMYGDWTVEDDDVREVIAYRAGLNVAALGTGLHSAVHVQFVLCHTY